MVFVIEAVPPSQLYFLPKLNYCPSGAANSWLGFSGQWSRCSKPHPKLPAPEHALIVHVHENIALLEGAEPNALRGATATLPRVRSIIFASWHSGDSDETAQILRQAGFVISPDYGRNWLAQ